MNNWHKFTCILVLFALAVSIPHLVSGQRKCRKVKLHAYQRVTLPGMIPRGIINEQGKEVRRPMDIKPEFFIYLEYPPRHILKIDTIWIEGFAHTVNEILRQVSPVLIGKTPIGNLERTDTLVPKTRNDVIRIKLNPVVHPGTASREDRAAVIRVDYTIRKKRFYVSSNEIKKLEPLALQ